MPTKGRVQVAPGQLIQSAEWGNPLWDQSVQCFDTAADRTAQYPNPHPGAQSWLNDLQRVETYVAGAWHAYTLADYMNVPAAGWSVAGADNRDIAAVDIAPGAPWSATLVCTAICTVQGNAAASPSVRLYAPGLVVVNEIPITPTSSAMTLVGLYRSDDGAGARLSASVSIPFGWTVTTYGSVGGLQALVTPGH